jgi:hypothetical protein
MEDFKIKYSNRQKGYIEYLTENPRIAGFIMRSRIVIYANEKTGKKQYAYRWIIRYDDCFGYKTLNEAKKAVEEGIRNGSMEQFTSL